MQKLIFTSCRALIPIKSGQASGNFLLLSFSLFQEETWQHIINGESGLVNAPTGCGKTFSVFLGAVIDFINHHPDDYKTKKKNGLQLLWITPLRALAKDIGRAMEEVIDRSWHEMENRHPQW